MTHDEFLTQEKVIQLKRHIIEQSNFLGAHPTEDDLNSYDDFLSLKIIQVRTAKQHQPNLTKEEATTLLLSQPAASISDFTALASEGMNIPALLEFIHKFFSEVRTTKIPEKLTIELVDLLAEMT